MINNWLSVKELNSNQGFKNGDKRYKGYKSDFM